MNWSRTSFLLICLIEFSRDLCYARRDRKSSGHAQLQARDEISYFKGDPGSLSENPNTFPDVIHTLQNTITSNLYPDSTRQDGELTRQDGELTRQDGEAMRPDSEAARQDGDLGRAEGDMVHPAEEQNVQGDYRNSIERGRQEERNDYPSYELVNDGRKRDSGPPGFSPDRVFNPQPIKRVKKKKATGPEAATYFGDNQEEEESPQQKLATLISKPIIHDATTGVRRHFTEEGRREELNAADERPEEESGPREEGEDHFEGEERNNEESNYKAREEESHLRDVPDEAGQQFAPEGDTHEGEERYGDAPPKEVSQNIEETRGRGEETDEGRRGVYEKRMEIKRRKNKKSELHRRSGITHSRLTYPSKDTIHRFNNPRKESDDKPLFTLKRRRLWGNIEKRWRRSKMLRQKARFGKKRSETSQSYDAYGSIGNAIGGNGGSQTFPPTDIASDSDEPSQNPEDLMSALHLKGKFQSAGVSYKDDSDENREYFHPMTKDNIEDESIEEQAREISDHPPSFTEALEQLPPDLRKAISDDAHASPSFDTTGQSDKRSGRGKRAVRRHIVRKGKGLVTWPKKILRRSVSSKVTRKSDVGKQSSTLANSKRMDPKVKAFKASTMVVNDTIPGSKRNKPEKLKTERAKTRTYDTYEAPGLPDSRSTEHDTGMLEDNEHNSFQYQLDHDSSPIVMKIAEHDREDMHKLWDNGHSAGNGFYTGHGEGPNRPYLGDYLNGEGITNPEPEHEDAHALEDTPGRPEDHHTENLIDAIWEHDMEDHHHGNIHGDKVLGYFGTHQKPEQNVLLPTETLDGIAGHWTGNVPHGHIEQYENEQHEDSDHYQFSPDRVKAIQAIQDDPSIDAELQTLGIGMEMHHGSHGGGRIGHMLSHLDPPHLGDHEGMHEEAEHTGQGVGLPLHSFHEMAPHMEHEHTHMAGDHHALTAGMDLTPPIEDSVGVEDSHEEEYKQHIDNILHKYRGLEERLKGVHGSLFDHLDASPLQHHHHQNYHSGVDLIAYKNPWDNMRLPYHVPVDNHPLNINEEPVIPPGFPGGKGDDKGGLLEGGKEEGGKGGPPAGEEKPPEKPEKPPKKEDKPEEKPPEPKPPKKDDDKKPTPPLNREKQKEPDWGQLPLPIVPQQKSGVGNASSEEEAHHSEDGNHSYKESEHAHGEDKYASHGKEEGRGHEEEEARDKQDAHFKEEGRNKGEADTKEKGGALHEGDYPSHGPPGEGHEKEAQSHDKESASHEREGGGPAREQGEHAPPMAAHEKEGREHDEDKAAPGKEEAGHESESYHSKDAGDHPMKDGGNGKEGSSLHSKEEGSAHDGKGDEGAKYKESGAMTQQGKEEGEYHGKEEASNHYKEEQADFQGKQDDKGSASHSSYSGGKDRYADGPPMEKEAKVKEGSDDHEPGKLEVNFENHKHEGEAMYGKDAHFQQESREGASPAQQMTTEQGTGQGAGQGAGLAPLDSKSESASDPLGALDNAKVPNTIESQQLARLQQLSALQQTLLKSLAKQAFPVAGQTAPTGGVEGASQGSTTAATEGGSPTLQQIANLQKLQQLAHLGSKVPSPGAAALLSGSPDASKDQTSNPLLQLLHGFQQKSAAAVVPMESSSSSISQLAAKDLLGGQSSPTPAVSTADQKDASSPVAADQSKFLSIQSKLRELLGTSAATAQSSPTPSSEAQPLRSSSIQNDAESQSQNSRLSFLQSAEQLSHGDTGTHQSDKVKSDSVTGNPLASALSNSVKQQLLSTIGRMHKGHGRHHRRHHRMNALQQENAYSNIGFETPISEPGAENSVKKEKYPHRGPLAMSEEQQTGTSRESLPEGPRDVPVHGDLYSESSQARASANSVSESTGEESFPDNHLPREREYAMEESSQAPGHEAYAEDSFQRQGPVSGSSNAEENSRSSEYGTAEHLPMVGDYSHSSLNEEKYSSEGPDRVQGERSAMMEQTASNGFEEYPGVQKTKISRHEDEEITSKKSLIKSGHNVKKAASQLHIG